MSIVSGCFADTNLSDSNFFWITSDSEIDNMPEQIQDGTLVVSIATKNKWVKADGEWAPYGG